MASHRALVAMLILSTLASGCVLRAARESWTVDTGKEEVLTHPLILQGGLHVRAGGQLVVDDTILDVRGPILLEGRLHLRNATLIFQPHTPTSAFTIRGGELESFGSKVLSHSALRVDGGRLVMMGGNLATVALVVDRAGRASLTESELAVVDGPVEVVDGSLRLDNTAVLSPRYHIGTSGVVRLLGVAANPTQFEGPGRAEVGWHLLVRARTPQGEPVPNATIQLRSVPHGDAVESEGFTDATGDVTVDAIEYSVAGGMLQTHNPHRLSASGYSSLGVALVIQSDSEATVLVSADALATSH